MLKLATILGSFLGGPYAESERDSLLQKDLLHPRPADPCHRGRFRKGEIMLLVLLDGGLDTGGGANARLALVRTAYKISCFHRIHLTRTFYTRSESALGCQ